MGQWDYMKKDCSRKPEVEDHICTDKENTMKILWEEKNEMIIEYGY